MTASTRQPQRRSLRSCSALAATLALSLGSALGAQINLSPIPLYPDLTVGGVLDYDHDGVAEVIATEDLNGELGAYRLDALGRPVLVRTLADNDYNVESIIAADMDGDGRDDLVGIANALIVFYDRGGSQLERQVISGPLFAAHMKKIVPTDFDSDGDQDLLIYASAYRSMTPFAASDGIHVIENFGGGFYSSPTSVMLSPEPLRSAAVIDLHQDGDLDFVAVRPDNGRLVLARNTGATLQVVGLLASESDIQDLDVGDVNGDGFDDVVTLRAADPWNGPVTVDLYLGNGNGTLTNPTALLVDEPNAAFDITLLDVDGDGALDIALPKIAQSSLEPTILLMAGDGLGGFVAPTFHVRLPGTQRSRSLVADVNGDGRADLVQSIVRDGGFSGSIEVPVVLTGSTDATGPALVELSQLGASMLHRQHETGDLNGDGVTDIVVEARHSLMVFLGAANSRYFRAPREFSMLPESVTPLLIEDINGDGRGDVIATSTDHNGFETLGVILTRVNVTDSTFQAIGPYHGYGQRLRAFDWDNDGDLDLMGITQGSVQLEWYENQGLGSFAGPTGIPLNSAALSYSVFAVGDFNGDGEPDIAAEFLYALPFSMRIGWFEGLGGGILGPEQSVGPTASPMTVADVDSDGFDDLLCYEHMGFGQRVIKRVPGSMAGLLVQSPDILVPLAQSSRAMELIDLEVPGRTDLVLFGSDGSVRVHESNGPGTFSSLPTTVVPGGIAPGPGPDGPNFTVVDLGGDGDRDVLFATSIPDVFWFENVGLGDVGTNYCGPAVPNSIGASGHMLALGSNQRALNELQLHALDLPPLVFGFFLASQTATPATPIASSNGEICLGGQIGRFVGAGEIQNSGFNGSTNHPGAFSLELDLASIPTPAGFVSVAIGSTWNFQAWHRDTTAAGVSSNFTDAVSVTF